MEGYRLIIKPSASKELQAITDKDTLLRVIERIKLLQVQPRPSGSEKLAGRLSLYRVRQGNYRVIYSAMINLMWSILLKSAIEEMSIGEIIL